MPLPAVSRLAGGIATSVSLLMLCAFKPAGLIGLVALVGAIICLRKNNHLLAGLLLGTASVSLLVSPPATSVYNHCTYQAVITKADYSQQSRGKSLILAAKHVMCLDDNSQPQQLADQKILFYDHQKQFTAFNNQNVRLAISSKLEPIHARLNHYTFDYEKYLHEKGLRLQAKAVNITGQSNTKGSLLTVRNALATRIQQYLAPPEAALMLALLIGNRSALSQQQKQRMQNTGTSHILAISGLHLALVGGWTWLIIQWLWGLSLTLNRYLQPIQAAAIATLLVITLYAVVSGFDIPVRRAWLMFLLLIVSWLWLTPINTQSLLLAACIVILTDPYAILSVGFYFSFTATAVVLWATRLPYPPLIKIVIMQATIALTLFPITWLVFGNIALGGFFTNLLIIPWLGLWVLPSALLACLLSLFSNSQLLWELTTFSIQSLWAVIIFFDQLEFTLKPVMQPTLIAVVLSVSCTLYCLYQKKIRYLIAYLTLWLPLPQSTTPQLIMADSRYSSTLIHNGRSAILINPGRKYRHMDDSRKWQRYLTNHRLSLSFIVLTNDKISYISATNSLLEIYPKAQVVTLEAFDLPYPANYCQPIQLEQLSLVTLKENNRCQATLFWLTKQIQLKEKRPDTVAENAILPGAKLRWGNQIYPAQQLGAITVEANKPHKLTGESFQISYLRQQKKPWREPITTSSLVFASRVFQQSGQVTDKGLP